ncbi:hypothetical protein PPL_07612 [Heterostelium album PN500]|uniref:N-acetyltransferase domain-containing protein n=1 Tax=Heterostelium pallidum (strain ATCC 26659 / Pp 5 / PN500) TaxID=670386 RepID=D3BGG1_HETP5|nr:hypothetical protein PPL_07612 [Heterostelium album PN500]EFA79561.1 hypothetical protein PPL_07612 [Heterostelium album PN500]|eukprot:XP_020431682.1 hypothetical protein PPL_07612 [Heterostelium album PN500]
MSSSSSSSSSSQDKVVHNKDKNFSLTLENGGICLILFYEYDIDVAHLDYKRQENEFDFYHTFVPTSGRGKGIAEILAGSAMNFIKDTDSRVILSCSYLSDRWLPKNPAFTRYVIKAFTKR